MISIALPNYSTILRARPSSREQLATATTTTVESSSYPGVVQSRDRARGVERRRIFGAELDRVGPKSSDLFRTKIQIVIVAL